MIVQILNKDRRSHLVAIVKGRHTILFPNNYLNLLQSRKQNIEMTC